MTTQQKALFVPAPSEEVVVRPTAILKPGPGQLLVKVEAAALNPADWKVPKFDMFTDSYPLVLGFDGAGHVEDVGADTSGFRKGDRVIFQGWHDEAAKVLHGTFQQYIVVPTYIAAKIPSSISYAAASTLFSCVVTIGIGLYSHKPGTESLKLTPPWDGGLGKYAGKSIFIAGGASNVGQFAIQFAKLSGFSPIVTTASLHNADHLKSLGATHVVDRKLPYENIVGKVTVIAGSPVDLALDGISEDDTLKLAAAVLAHGGQLVYVNFTKEELVKKLAADKGLETVCTRGFQYTEKNRGALAGLYEKLPEFLEQGLIQPVPYEVLRGGLNGVASGLKRLENNQVSGVKLVVLPPQTK